jgi:hypothetical protein
MNRVTVGLGIRLALLGSVAACGAAAPEAGGVDLHQAWSEFPIVVTDSVIDEGLKVCRRESGFNLERARVTSADARGEGRINLVLVGPSGATRCGLHASSGGLSFSDGGEMLDLPHESATELPGAARLRGVDTSSETQVDGATTSRTVAVGQAPTTIVAVDVVLEGGRRVRAAVNYGWFSAWWPTDEKVMSVVTIDAAGRDVVSVRPT